MSWHVDYWTENLRRSFKVWEKSQATTAFIVLVLSAVLGAGAGLGINPIVDSVKGSILIGLGLGFGLPLFIVSPMRMWKESKDTTARLELDKVPILQIESVKEEDGPSLSSRGWGLIVRNTSTIKASGCSARIEEITFETANPSVTLSRYPTDRPLHWAAQQSETYEIPGRQTAHLNVVYTERPTFRQTQVTLLAYIGADTFRQGFPLPDNVGPIWLSVNLVCDGANPQYVVCRVVPSLLNSLLTRGYSDDTPFRILWVSEIRPSLEEFQAIPILDQGPSP